MGSVLVERGDDHDQGDDGVAVVTLDRPERKNALTLEGFVELGEVFDSLADDPAVRTVVLTGAGGNFCTGSDLGSRKAQHPLDRMRRINRAVISLAEFPKPVIASVEGYAVGAGWNMALLCDLVVASRTAQFSQIFARRGLSVDFGGSWILPRLVGLHRAKRLVLLAETVDAAEAYDLGLVSMLTEPEDLDATARSLATRLAQGAPVALGQSARLLEHGSTSSLAEALDREAAAQTVNFATDAPAALAAFVAKEKPVFAGDWLVGTAPDRENTDRENAAMTGTAR